MNLPSALRAALLAKLPVLANDPQRMAIFASKGHLVATGTAARGFEYAYTLTVIVQDFAGDMDVLAATVLDWIAETQPDILKNPERREKALRFEVEILDNEQADVQLELDVSEAVQRQGADFIHPDPPPVDQAAEVGFVGRVARLARLHQEGLMERASPKARSIAYPRHELLGLTEADREWVREMLVEHLTK